MPDPGSGPGARPDLTESDPAIYLLVLPHFPSHQVNVFAGLRLHLAEKRSSRIRPHCWRSAGAAEAAHPPVPAGPLARRQSPASAARAAGAPPRLFGIAQVAGRRAGRAGMTGTGAGKHAAGHESVPRWPVIRPCFKTIWLVRCPPPTSARPSGHCRWDYRFFSIVRWGGVALDIAVIKQELAEGLDQTAAPDVLGPRQAHHAAELEAGAIEGSAGHCRAHGAPASATGSQCPHRRSRLGARHQLADFGQRQGHAWLQAALWLMCNCRNDIFLRASSRSPCHDIPTSRASHENYR